MKDKRKRAPRTPTFKPDAPPPPAKSLRDDPEVQSMTHLLKAGRDSERMDILEELEGRLTGTRGWWRPGTTTQGDEAREALSDFKRWLEARNR